MQITRKRMLGTLAATSLIVGAVAPVVAQSDDSRSSKHLGTLFDRGHDTLSVRGLTADGRLIAFNERRPALARTLGEISGLTGDTRLVGIDHRPATGDLYGVGEQGGVYTLDSRAHATKRAQLSVALSGTSFGVDFNPVVDRLRIVSDTGQSLRADVSTGATTADAALTYPPASTPAAGVTGAAYTNNDADLSTSTTLFDLDIAMDQIAIQSPANSGQLTATGKLGVDASAPSGFDIYSTVRRDTTIDVRGAAALTVDGRSRFYAVDVLQGRATDRGAFRNRNEVVGIAIPLNQR